MPFMQGRLIYRQITAQSKQSMTTFPKDASISSLRTNVQGLAVVKGNKESFWSGYGLRKPNI